ncbi:MAG: hypothetical protein QM708_07110 [Propioniciclava sp.]|uniref:hypothetical protein n=1 Tax=Propioniciclava sp. TaxID=2038686 RepID=UPI0039E3E202
MPVFERVSRYPYPRALVFDWHTRPAAFLRLHPPGMTTPLKPPTDGINVGSESEIVVSHPLIAALLPGVSRKGAKRPLGVRWRLRHIDLEPGVRFVDQQLFGAVQALVPRARVRRRPRRLDGDHRPGHLGVAGQPARTAGRGPGRDAA